MCVRLTKRPIFEFVSSAIHPNDSLTVFPLADDYSFGILQSDVHWRWFIARCSTLKRDFRCTSETVFDSFPWPQAPIKRCVTEIANAAVAVRIKRRELMETHKLSLRLLYRSLEQPGKHPLEDVHSELDRAVRKAYGIDGTDDVLSHLFALNQEVAESEKAAKTVVGPGLPPGEPTTPVCRLMVDEVTTNGEAPQEGHPSLRFEAGLDEDRIDDLMATCRANAGFGAALRNM